jgi:hypothetical protein
LHKIAKDVAGGQSPDREAQFQRIAALKAEYLDGGNPVFSMTTVNVIRRIDETGRQVAADFKAGLPILFDDLLPKWNDRAVPH